jgi:NADP-dependent 3-hydroxy acid dehydrogenase YdfG
MISSRSLDRKRSNLHRKTDMNTEPQALSGKVALVTRGSWGIGAAIVWRLARDSAAVAFT